MERNTREPESLRLTPQCGAKRRDGLPCQKPRARGRSRCRLHRRAQGSGGPKGKANGRYSHGLLTAETMQERNCSFGDIEEKYQITMGHSRGERTSS